MSDKKLPPGFEDPSLPEMVSPEMVRRAERVTTVAEGLMREIARVRDQVMPSYILIGIEGELALANMRGDLDHAVRALAYHDGPECIRLLAQLRGYET